MRTDKENLLDVNAHLPYEAPCMKSEHVELEYSVAAGSVEGRMTESWQSETQSQDVEWN